ncbi:hypothetical protein SEUCBS139899_009041 [Sporothrix eucalyptigena]|uniref:Uncharacterized protein n=1 Tax=Sporothrix eucalyptigena TaxID=1812306 RepID=A0ABP0C4P2_9PEZI
MVAAIQGLWYNYAEKRIYDATITLSLRYANYLVAGLSTAVTIAGSSFWTITAFILHSFFARRGNDATVLHYQHQVILTNAGSTTSTMTDGAKTMMAWWSRGIRCVFWRTISFIIPPFIVWAGFLAAGIFVADVATNSYVSTVVRAQPNNCGLVNVSTSSIEASMAYGSKVLNDTYQARAYMTNFYQNQTTSASVAESVYVMPALPYTINTAAACPVPDTSLCITGHNGAISFTSMPIDSQTMLGINAKKDSRVKLKMSTTCAPLDSSGYTEKFQNRNTGLTESLFFLGPIDDSTEFTYSYTEQMVNETTAYLLEAVYAFAGDASASAWQPIDALARDDADLTVLFFSQNGAAYLDPVYDPFFLANGSFTEELGGTTFYQANKYVNTLVCADQYTLCNPNTNTCTPTGGFQTLARTATENTPGFNTTQYATATRIIEAISQAGIYNSVNGLNAAALFATNQLIQSLSPALPDNQWQTEVAGWFGTSMAKIQASIVEFAVKSSDLGPYMFVNSPYDTEHVTDSFALAVYQAWQDQCTGQLVQLTGSVQNFSFLGILIVACTTVSLGILGLCLGKIVDKIGHNGPARTARQTDDKFHLQRMAMGPPTGPGNAWEKRAFGVPVLAHGTERFARSTPVNDEETEFAGYAHAVPMALAVNPADGVAHCANGVSSGSSNAGVPQAYGRNGAVNNVNERP